MKVNRNYLNLDEDGREILEDGLQLFQLILNEGDINGYLTGSIPPHYHSELELFMLDSGSVSVGIKDESFTLEAGDGCFINSGVIHSYKGLTTESCAYRSFVFSPSIVGGMAGSVFDSFYIQPLIQNGPANIIFSSQDEQYRTLFDKAFLAASGEEDGYEFQVRNMLSDLILLIRRKCSMDGKEKPSLIQDERVKKLLAWLDDHIAEDIQIAELAAAAGISARECQRLFVRYLHYSPARFISRKRVFTAAGMLVNSNRSISEIAFLCGFSSTSYFSKQFKLITGTSPLDYRKKAETKLEEKS